MTWHRDSYRSSDPDRRFTMSALWVKQLRPRYLAANPWCAHCLALGLNTVATSVDHIQRPRGNPALQRDPANWQALCGEHHGKKSAWERMCERKGKVAPLRVGHREDGYPVDWLPSGFVVE